MVMLKVLNVIEGKVASTGATRYTVAVRELSTGEEHKASYFAEGELPFGMGDEVQGQLEVKGQYKNLRNVTPIRDLQHETQEEPKPVPKTTPAPVPQTVWDGKDERMVRMNCLTHATKIVNTQHPNPEAFDSEGGRADMIKMVAMGLRDWVYQNGEIPPTEVVAY